MPSSTLWASWTHWICQSCFMRASKSSEAMCRYDCGSVYLQYHWNSILMADGSITWSNIVGSGHPSEHEQTESISEKQQGKSWPRREAVSFWWRQRQLFQCRNSVTSQLKTTEINTRPKTQKLSLDQLYYFSQEIYLFISIYFIFVHNTYWTVAVFTYYKIAPIMTDRNFIWCVILEFFYTPKYYTSCV